MMLLLTFSQANLGAAGIPERALGDAAGDTVVGLDGSVERAIKRLSIGLEILGARLNNVDEAESEGLWNVSAVVFSICG
jgi:hypothetical protein